MMPGPESRPVAASTRGTPGSTATPRPLRVCCGAPWKTGVRSTSGLGCRTELERESGISPAPSEPCAERMVFVRLAAWLVGLMECGSWVEVGDVFELTLLSRPWGSKGSEPSWSLSLHSRSSRSRIDRWRWLYVRPRSPVGANVAAAISLADMSCKRAPPSSV